MEFRNPLEEYSDDDDGALSFCDLVTEQGVLEITLRDSNSGSFDQEDFCFDFDFGRCGLTTDHIVPADDLFEHGHTLPLAPQKCRSESVRYSSFGKSNSEYLLTWRKDSLDSQSSLWSTSSSTSSSSQRKTHSGEISRLSNSKSKRKHKRPASGGKMSSIWRVLTLGLMKTPSMKLESMHLKQGKTNSNINGAKNLDLRQSVSCNYYEDPKLEQREPKSENFQENCRSMKEHMKEHVVVEKTPWLKRWKSLARLPSFNSSKTSSNVVVENGG